MTLIRAAICSVILVTAYPAFSQNTPHPSLDEHSLLRPAGFKPRYPESSTAIARGRQLFKDPRMSTNGRSCSSCHTDIDSFGARFGSPYPHAAMNSKARFGVDQMHLDEIIQVCMQGPMRNLPFEWGSREQIDITTYLLKVQVTGKM